MSSFAPLAERMRPKTLAEFVGQENLTNPDSLFSKSISQNQIPSMILWGPTGSGKTTLAQIIKSKSSNTFHSLSALNSGVKEIREVIDSSKKTSLFKTGPDILFIDEIHRFNKSQQESLLEAVEKGWISLIGATTENPSFEVINALLSRLQVYILNPLEVKDLEKLLFRAINEDLILKEKKVKLIGTKSLIALSGGDARRLLNILEMVCLSFSEKYGEITNSLVDDFIKRNPLLYDKSGDKHYDTISAFIKSMRGSDPQASIYWLAKMIYSGENPLFIARRMLVLSSEDIGNANPQALVIANACFSAVSSLGMPESRIVLAQTAIYLANSPKSNAAYLAIDQAIQFVKNNPEFPVPIWLRNAPTELMKKLGIGEDYLYPHDFLENFVPQAYLPESIKGQIFYYPSSSGEEIEAQKIMEKRWGKP